MSDINKILFDLDKILGDKFKKPFNDLEHAHHTASIHDKIDALGKQNIYLQDRCFELWKEIVRLKMQIHHGKSQEISQN